MRHKLPQFVVNPKDEGYVRVFHSNNWAGTRQTGQHWGGDLPTKAADAALQEAIERLTQNGWDLSPEITKILMLTHRGLASRQGYNSLPGVFEFNEVITKKENAHIAVFADSLEPACEAFLRRKYGEMFLALGGTVPAISGRSDKEKWSTAMTRLIELRNKGTVGEVIDYLRQLRRPRLPDAVERRERELEQFNREADDEMPRALTELEALRAVSYREIIALCRYLAGHSPFETKHGVKGAEFENVLVVVGRGWNQYNFNQMLELSQDPDHIPANKRKMFQRNRNLFYVTCSRPKRRLAILFTQELSAVARHTLDNWFGDEVIEALKF